MASFLKRVSTSCRLPEGTEEDRARCTEVYSYKMAVYIQNPKWAQVQDNKAKKEDTETEITALKSLFTKKCNVSTSHDFICQIVPDKDLSGRNVALFCK